MMINEESQENALCECESHSKLCEKPCKTVWVGKFDFSTYAQRIFSYAPLPLNAAKNANPNAHH